MHLFLGLGTNLGDRERNLALAVNAIARLPGVQVGRRSSIWESPPVGPPQPDFLDAVLEVDTVYDAKTMLRFCKRIEEQLGRVPGERWGPRLIDLDLLLADVVVAEPALQVPHMELHKRAFVLEPLCELEPQAVHPVLQRPLLEILGELGDQGVRRVGPLYVDV